MRFAPDRGFLYPVLGQREYNYPGKKFSVDVECRVEDNSLILTANFDLDVESISSLIDDGSARCILWVYCGATSYRQIFCSDSTKPRTVDGKLSIQNVRDQLEIHPQITAVEELCLHYHEANRAFGGGPVKLRSGNLLAVHKPSFTKVSEIEDRSTKSIFQLKKDSVIQQEGWEAQIDVQQPFIELVANEETYNNFDKLRKDDPKHAVQTLYLSALVETLYVYLKDRDPDEASEPDTSNWVDVITVKLLENNITVSDDGSARFVLKTMGQQSKSVLWVAQKLLEFPLFIQDEVGELE